MSPEQSERERGDSDDVGTSIDWQLVTRFDSDTKQVTETRVQKPQQRQTAREREREREEERERVRQRSMVK
jgi:hypothetical protein